MRQQNDADVSDSALHQPEVHDQSGQCETTHHVKRFVIDVEKQHNAQNAHGQPQVNAEQVVQAADGLSDQPVPDPERFDDVCHRTRRFGVHVRIGVGVRVRVSGQRGGVESRDLAVNVAELAVQRVTLFGELRFRTAHAQILHVNEHIQADHVTVDLVKRGEHVHADRVHRHDERHAQRDGGSREPPVAADLGGRGGRVQLVRLQRLLVQAEPAADRVQQRDPGHRARHVHHARVDLLQHPHRLASALHAHPAHDPRYREERVNAHHRQHRGG